MAVGANAIEMEEQQVLVFFGADAPEALQEVSITHRIDEPLREGELAVGSRLLIGRHEFRVTAVGEAAAKNIAELSHLVVYFQTPEEQILPGAVYVEPFRLPEITPGMIVQITGLA